LLIRNVAVPRCGRVWKWCYFPSRKCKTGGKTVGVENPSLSSGVFLRTVDDRIAHLEFCPGFKLGNGNVNPKIGWPDPRLYPPDSHITDRNGQKDPPLCASFPLNIGWRKGGPLCAQVPLIPGFTGVYPLSIRSLPYSHPGNRSNSAQRPLPSFTPLGEWRSLCASWP